MTLGRDEVLRLELKELIQQKQPLTLASIRGQIEWISRTRSDHEVAPEAWVLRAHEGTVQKFEELLLCSPLKNPIELIALARNVFENLVWLRIFNQNKLNGYVFYMQLLRQQLESQEQAIEKAKEEIAIFKSLSDEETPDFEVISHLCETDNPSEANMRKVREYIRAHEAEVDAKVRLTFSLYGHQAKTNGFDYQAHLIETKAIPHHQDRINTVAQAIKSLLEAVPDDIPVEIQRALKSGSRWNWRDRAASVGLLSQYKFLYSFTSRLLHCTPMNLITSKELDMLEVCALLDYLCVAVADAYAQIEEFNYTGKVNIVLLRSDPDA